MENFLKTLRLKVLEKARKFPEFKFDKDKLLKAKSFSDFDGLYTAPVFGYSGAEDYWEKASSKPYLKFIETPTLLITSKDDPFLGEEETTRERFDFGKTGESCLRKLFHLCWHQHLFHLSLHFPRRQ